MNHLIFILGTLLEAKSRHLFGKDGYDLITLIHVAQTTHMYIVPLQGPLPVSRGPQHGCNLVHLPCNPIV